MVARPDFKHHMEVDGMDEHGPEDYASSSTNQAVNSTDESDVRPSECQHFGCLGDLGSFDRESLFRTLAGQFGSCIFHIMLLGSVIWLTLVSTTAKFQNTHPDVNFPKLIKDSRAGANAAFRPVTPASGSSPGPRPAGTIARRSGC